MTPQPGTAEAVPYDTKAPLTSGEARVALVPKQPRTLEEAGLDVDFVEQLLIKTLYGGNATGHGLADRLRLPYGILEPLLDRVRAAQQVEVRGSAGSGSASYQYALTGLGRDRAMQYLDASHYVGAAPVPLEAYVDAMRALANVRGYLDRARLQSGFSHLVMNERVLEQVGPAANGGKAIFLYGPPGNGKSVIAEGIGRALGGDMYVPYAISVDGHVITMFDPVNHESLDPSTPFGRSGQAPATPSGRSGQAPDGPSVVAPAPWDRRWVRVRRPVVIVGGELTLDMLDLTFNPLSRFYEAPLQLKANGGVFLVDDFGRQRMRPQDLLNRWIVPLESRVDYLTLHTGKKFQVPFDVLIVFATNLDPRSLADEAFLRRIPYKIPIADPTVDEFTQIFEMNCRKRGLDFHPVMAAYLVRRHFEPKSRPLRACHARDLLDQVTALCRYRGIEPMISRELLDRACESYFVDEEDHHVA